MRSDGGQQPAKNGQIKNGENGHAESTNGTNGTSTTSNGQIYEVIDIPGSGLGVIAASKIPKGTRIIAEDPLFIIPKVTNDLQSVEKTLLKELKSLTKEQQHEFFSLCNAHKGHCSPVVGITKTNAIPFGSRGAAGGVFPRAARINHSCRPNSQNSWNNNLGKLTIHAFKDIEEGDEVTIAYVDGAEHYETRKETLDGAFAFKCECPVCAISPEESKQRDRRLAEMGRLDDSLGDARRILTKPQDCLDDAHTMLRMLNDEKITGSRISRVYNDALQISIAHSDQARAKVFAERAHALRLILEGDDSPETMRLKGLIEKPASHGLYGKSNTWAQTAKAIPKALSEEDFESWLWRRDGWKDAS